MQGAEIEDNALCGGGDPNQVSTVLHDRESPEKLLETDAIARESHIPTRSSLLRQAMRSKRSSGLETQETHQQRPSITEAVLQAE
jgi:hypothetical protein